ncbi:hypothetical protein A2V49_04560 [candidate division WWE3 bacterium RBG_19FT_COMBO_34_6]|uniref:Glycosyl transferase family 11 n=1 Tax=candidate division WWE3 bacterium RBG_19FT_COMBO_34_6 TaxID=1802612 RepID=A0A1F4UMD3_UNCKA|nr:MAG: hypothetical protein A2V49_04560 [candidate division WWE3 bacterium RBG_19FT_COMBO_34_6]
MGGLGNQLFQYAFGRAISLKNSIPVYFDITDYSRSTTNIKRDFELAKFPNIKAKYINSAFLRSAIRLKLIKKITDSEYDISKKKYYSVKLTYFSGYWQNLHYFQDFEATIRKELDIPVLINNQYFQQISQKNSVSMHIRLSDYLLPDNASIYKQLTSKYYIDSFDLIRSKIENPSFFIFSDDIEQAKQILKDVKEDITYIDNNHNTFEDFRLMKACKHNIIANSTFSWWTAWLNQNNEKVVIVPKQWYTYNDVTNIYPEDWVLI